MQTAAENSITHSMSLSLQNIYICLSVCLYLQPRGECPWLAYTTLCAEQSYEEEEGIWKALLQQLRQDPKATVDTALKVLYWEGGTIPPKLL